MYSSPPISEFDAFNSTARRREKPSVPLMDVTILSNSRSPTPVDLFDALFKGPFSAKGTYIYSSKCKLKCKRNTPCTIRLSNIERFAVEECIEGDSQPVKIYFEGELAWYEIVTPHSSFSSIFADMQLKAQVWMWIQCKRSAVLVKSKRKTKWPSLKQCQRELPPHLNSRIVDPLDVFHPYLIERIIQSHLSGDKLSVGPEGTDPRWMECQLAVDFKDKYPTVWQSIYDQIEATLEGGRAPRSSQQEPISSLQTRSKVQKPSKETRHLRELFKINVDEIKQSPNIAAAAQIILESLSSSDPWQDFTGPELLEKIENHAEALLSNTAFLKLFKGWPGIDGLKAFCGDRNWWKRKPISQGRLRARRGKRIRVGESPDVSEATESTSMGIANIGSSQQDVSIETPAPMYPKTARKGTSSLRPRFSMSQTPGTPIPQVDGQRTASEPGVDSENDSSDDELQLLKVPPDVSRQEQHEERITRKRKFDESNENAFIHSKKGRNTKSTTSNSVQFGRGRPPLTTVPMLLASKLNERSTVFRCPFPSCSYTRTCSMSTPAKADIDRHHHSHRNEIQGALDMLKDPFIIGGRVGGEKGNRLIRPIGGIDHLIERIEEMSKALGSTPSKRLVI